MKQAATGSNSPNFSRPVPFREAFWTWVKVALYSFGGPAGQISVMHRLLVEEKRWISQDRFLNALNYCMLLPGPEAQQLATYIGWLLHKVPGGLIAGTLFVLPGFISILLLSLLYSGFQDTTLVQAFFYGLKPAVVAVIVAAVMQMGKRALKNGLMVGITVCAFVAISFLKVPFPLLILGAGLFGLVGAWGWPSHLNAVVWKSNSPPSHPSQQAVVRFSLTTVRPSWSRTFRVILVCCIFWFGPLIALRLTDANPVYRTQGTLFSKAAVVSFGGAYAALAYVGEEAVETYQWLDAGEMLDGLGMAETTPGPLIQVVQFVGFLSAYRSPGTLGPVAAGIWGSLITTWVTFVPCFLWIFVGAPYIESLRKNRFLATALSVITAAVVGVVLNLGFWFSIRTLFGQVVQFEGYGMQILVPVVSSIDPTALAISIGAAASLLIFRVGMFKTLVGAALTGSIYWLLMQGGTV